MSKLCVSELCVSKLCVSELCVNDLYVSKLCGRSRRRKRRRKRRGDNLKTRAPHKDVGNNSCTSDNNDDDGFSLR